MVCEIPNKADKKFTARLPLLCDPNKLLAPNEREARGRLKRMLTKLKGDDERKKAIGQEFEKLLQLGIIVKLEKMSSADQERINKKQKCLLVEAKVAKNGTNSNSNKHTF